jgi:hypothetical protein
MDLLTILLIVLIVLALGGWGYGSYYPPTGGGTSPLVNLLGVVALILITALIVMLITGWRFGLVVAPP